MNTVDAQDVDAFNARKETINQRTQRCLVCTEQKDGVCLIKNVPTNTLIKITDVCPKKPMVTQTNFNNTRGNELCLQ